MSSVGLACLSPAGPVRTLVLRPPPGGAAAPPPAAPAQWAPASPAPTQTGLGPPKAVPHRAVAPLARIRVGTMAPAPAPAQPRPGLQAMPHRAVAPPARNRVRATAPWAVAKAADAPTMAAAPALAFHDKEPTAATRATAAATRPGTPVGTTALHVEPTAPWAASVELLDTSAAAWPPLPPDKVAGRTGLQ